MTIRRISLRYYAGYWLVCASRLFKSVLNKLFWVASLPERFSVIVWTPQEIDRYARADWNSWPSVRSYSRLDDWLSVTEKTLVETYFTKGGELLNVGCGAGREASLLARRGLRVTACDWSPRMIAEARRRAREANLSMRFEMADVYDLQYPENAFDYLLLTNIAYSYIFPRHRRIRFLRQAQSVLKSGGIFIISFASARDGSKARPGRLDSLFMKLRLGPPFNREYEPGDRFSGSFTHFFHAEDLAQELQEAQFLIKDWLWDEGYAVLVKL